MEKQIQKEYKYGSNGRFILADLISTPRLSGLGEQVDL